MSDFSDLSQVGQQLVAEAATPSPEPVSPTNQATSQTPPGSGSNEPAPTPAPVHEPKQSPSIAELTDDTIVMVQGKQMPWKQARDGYMRQADYTQKTQKLAEQARASQALEAKLQALEQREQVLRRSLANPDDVLGYAVTQFGPEAVSQWLQAQMAQPGQTPNQALHVQQVAQAQVRRVEQSLTGEMQKLRQEQQEALHAQAQALRQEREQAEHEKAISGTLSEIFTKHPELKVVSEMEDVLRYRVFARQPETIEQAKLMFIEEAGKQADAIRQFTVAQKKVEAVQQAKLGLAVEPPGGVGVSTQGSNIHLKPDGSVDWAALRESAIATLSR